VAIARALSPASAAASPQLDPRIVKLIKTGCGEEHVVAQATPRPFDPQAIPARIVLLTFNQSEPSPEPSGTPSSPPAAAQPTAQPTAPPTPLPLAPRGPGQILPPPISGTPYPTPPPPPSPSPVPGETGPVFLVNPTGPPPVIPPAGSTATPLPRPVPSAAGPTPVATLAPNQMAVLADEVHGFNRPHLPGDAVGNVHIFYSEGQLIGDRAHYDGDHTIMVSGHTYLINRNQDSILYADKIVFDTNTNRASLVNGRGESTEGVQRGKLHYSADLLSAYRTGVSHGDRGSFTTCENAHSGYHVEARTIDVYPNDKLVARKAVVFLGPLAILYLPFLVIPLRNIQDIRKPTSFLPVIGYSQLEGFYVKVRLSFNPSNTYYGYYRLEYYTKRGLGLGYAAYFGTKNNVRFATIDAFTIDDHLVGGRQTNVTLNETEYFSNRLKSQLSAVYTGDFGAGLSLPPRLDLNETLSHTGRAGSETLTFERSTQGSLSDTFNLGFVDMAQLSQALSETFNVSYGKFTTPGITADTLHLQSLTHLTTRLADYNLQYDKTDYSAGGSTFDRLPELEILPHINFHGYKFPFMTQLTVGDYAEPQNHFSTERAEIHFTQPVFLKLGASDFTANYDLRQDFYGTGDAKAYDMQQAALTTPIGQHIVNQITYNEAHPIGPIDVPFQTVDRLSGGSHGAQEGVRIFNGDVYSLSLSTSTSFARMAQPIVYQLNLRPSLRSYLLLGGSWIPGPGNGFYSTNVQGITAFGRDTTLQFSTNVDWKNKGRLENKTAFLSKIIGNCYRVDLSYNQDLRQVNFAVVILAFPNQAIGGAIGGNGPTSIIPQNFAGF
jgi:hypothetical protein